MEKIIVSCEATCDLPKELIEKYDIKVIDMEFLIDGEVFSTKTDSVTSSSLYSKMKKGSKTSTSQINSDLYVEFFENLVKYNDVIHIAFSSGLSETYRSALTASEIVNAKNNHKVHVIDSLCACSGQGLLAILAKKYSNEVKDIHKVVDFVEKLKHNINHIFTVDNLKYLANGGRIKSSTALIGNMLNIKPVMKADETGHLVNVNKVLSRKKALIALYNKLKTSIKATADTIFISHADCVDDANFVANFIKSELNINPIITDLGPVIGSHSGPGTIAIFYEGNGR